MKNLIRLGAVGTAMVVAMGMSSAAMAAATASSNATVEILKPIQLENISGLDFGAIAVNAAGTVVLSTENVATCTGGLVCTGTTSVSEFRVFNGTAGKRVTITMPENLDLVSTAAAIPGSPTAAEKVELTDFTTDAATRTVLNGTVSSTFREVTLSNTTAAANFKLGGTLTFDGSEASGTYNGTFSVTVEYS
ncbi:DUF4402 domain-containing protein [Altererythrobacter sp. SALINAS58]|uniref:DUF4402 domain-containing protein n=2 Tax=Pseudomonadota TaxID=1224 RepID=UPI001575E3B0|nr:DUF4402 domain-containing protein [Alteripontixanthobacter muriae]NTZ43521.1 DUF4402 domain-containing protein [Alteripontixanthobacter muriae]